MQSSKLRKTVAAMVSFAFLPAALWAVPTPAQAEPVLQPGVDSPALASTNENPTVVDGRTVPLDPRPGFRVLPYLQRPSDTGITINWFTELGTEAKITVTGPGLPAEGKTETVAGVHNPVNDYQDYELTQGDLTRNKELRVPQGAWIRADKPYKYSVDLTGLQTNSAYQYTVEVDGYAHSASFRTLPTPGSELVEPIHIIAFSDTETDPIGRVTYREWEQTLNLAEGSEERPGAGSAWDQKFGGSTRNGKYAVNYAVTEDQAQRLNNAAIAQAAPDLLLLPGDIAERASSQSHWDEWFRYFAGDQGHILDSIPVITSLGNHEVYGYGTPEDRTAVIRARAAYNQVFDTHGSDNANARDAYHRTDYGPVTVISLDSTNGQPDQSPNSESAPAPMTGNDANITKEQLGTDTQNQFTMEEIRRDFPKTVELGWWGEGQDPNSVDQPDFMPGSEQYKWLEKQLQDARAKGQTIVVQYHHVAYSNGVHGTTMGHEHADQQPGTPMRHLQPLFEKYGVAAVFSGHDEMFQASYVDENNDGVGVYHWDVGVASDGLRGEKMVQQEDGTYAPLRFNTHSVWMAQADEPEKWETNEAGVKHLVSGGKHYGHLDIKIAPYTGPALDSGKQPAASMVMTPISLFPILDDNYDLERVERRVLESGIQTVYLDDNGLPLAGKPVSTNSEVSAESGDEVKDDAGQTGADDVGQTGAEGTETGTETGAEGTETGAETGAEDVGQTGAEGTETGTETGAEGTDNPASEKPAGVWAVGNDARGVLYVNAWGQGKADRTVNYGNPNDEIIFGDWDGDGIDTPLVRRGNVFLGTNGFGGVAEFEFAYGNAGDEVLVGDWNGDGKDTVAVVRGNQVFVRNSLTSGVADAVYGYGNPTDTLIAGDWNGDGKDTLAAVRGNIFYVQSKLEDTKAPLEFAYGTAGDRVIVGDWNGDGKDGVGVVRGNQFFLKNKLATGAADEVFAYGNAKDVSVVGDWDGDGIDTPAVDRR
ncbi:Calcineurin-like phosphoesterase [Actinobaculum suis]|uniref:Calcineurin-like phosphoesterase n=1 Tax=Actinobaculum suis TaxID=1657 RepID=A0A7Z9C8V5_9ACTO|nr:metallophosphoesterase [Actinobaculum suis]VDG76866.1 Calcineurin-like phosphoesterase [Actinobaculum suis]